MTNSEIIDTLGGTTKVAKMCLVSPPAVAMWRKTGIPPDRMIFVAAQLEKATDGQVTRKMLFPNSWAKIWPELNPPEQ
jgi:DNA-binding transcriptional regulator YdaS (Cro superfamily)